MNYWDILLAEKLKKDPPLPPIPDNAYLLEEATGDVITLTDAAALPMPTATTNLTPIQDLHGYSSPWVGGAGKNLLKPTKRTTSSADVAYSVDDDGKITLSGLASADTSFTIFNGQTVPSVGYYTVSLYGAVNATLNTDTENLTVVGGVAIFTIVVRSGVQYNESFYVQIEQGTQATAYEPYSNICPISGYDSASYNRCGINVWDEEWENGYYDITTGEKVNGVNVRSKNPIRVIAGQKYYFRQATTTNNGMLFYDMNNNYVSYIPFVGNSIVTIPNGIAYITFYMSGSGYGATYNNDISINYPSTITTYQPYQGQAVTLTFDNTIYSGVIDWCTGVVTVDKAMDIYDGSEDEGWNKYGSGSASAYCMSKAINGVQRINNCNYLRIISHTETFGNYDGFISLETSQGTNGILYTGIKSITTVADWKTYLSNNNLQVLYELSTPTTIQLTPTQLKTLAGYNTIYTDVGNITLEYWRKEVRA